MGTVNRVVDDFRKVVGRVNESQDQTFNLNFDTDNEAMQSREQVAITIHSVANRVMDGERDGLVRDKNGNTVGGFGFNGRVGPVGRDFGVEMDLSNAAFEDPASGVQDALIRLSKRVKMGMTSGKVMDTNGNSVGTFYWHGEGENADQFPESKRRERNRKVNERKWTTSEEADELFSTIDNEESLYSEKMRLFRRGASRRDFEDLVDQAAEVNQKWTGGSVTFSDVGKMNAVDQIMDELSGFDSENESKTRKRKAPRNKPVSEGGFPPCKRPNRIDVIIRLTKEAVKLRLSGKIRDAINRENEVSMIIGSLEAGSEERRAAEDAEQEAQESAMAESKSRVNEWKNQAGELDPHAANELELYVDNTWELQNQMKSIRKNLLLKIVKGRYDHTKAPLLWQYLVDAGAKQYKKEFGTEGSHIFNLTTRKEVAKELANSFVREVQAGGITPEEYDVKGEIPEDFQNPEVLRAGTY